MKVCASLSGMSDLDLAGNADMVEIRLDLLGEVPDIKDRELLVTYRGPIDLGVLPEGFSGTIDIGEEPRPDTHLNVVASHHNYESTPDAERIRSILGAMDSDISKGVGEIGGIVRSVVRVGSEENDSLIGTLHRQQTVLAGHLPAHGFHLQAHGILHAVVVQATEVEHAVLSVRGERSFAERVGTVGDAEVLSAFLRRFEANGDDIGGIGDKGAAFVGHAIRRFVCHGGKG